MTWFVEKLEKWNSKIKFDIPEQSNRERRNSNIKEFLAVDDPESLDVLPPTGIANKGCGKGKRLKSIREKASKESKKPKRVCRKCGQRSRHDSRNCPNT